MSSLCSVSVPLRPIPSHSWAGNIGVGSSTCQAGMQISAIIPRAAMIRIIVVAYLCLANANPVVGAAGPPLLEKLPRPVKWWLVLALFVFINEEFTLHMEQHANKTAPTVYW